MATEEAVYGEALGWAMPSQFINAISILIRDILSVCTLGNNKLDKNKLSRPCIPRCSIW
jgi:E3 ubiquitin-protein ligase UBR1